MKKTILLILLVSLFVGCNTQRFYTTSDRGANYGKTEGTSHFFIYGIGQTKEYYPSNDVCRGRQIAMIETHYSFVNGLLAVLTSGIYTPLTYEITCGKKIKKTKAEKTEEEEEE
jgi:hypothetical protein